MQPCGEVFSSGTDPASATEDASLNQNYSLLSPESSKPLYRARHGACARGLRSSTGISRGYGDAERLDHLGMTSISACATWDVSLAFRWVMACQILRRDCKQVPTYTTPTPEIILFAKARLACRCNHPVRPRRSFVRRPTPQASISCRTMTSGAPSRNVVVVRQAAIRHVTSVQHTVVFTLTRFGLQESLTTQSEISAGLPVFLRAS
jgi:hypothetical protein